MNVVLSDFLEVKPPTPRGQRAQDPATWLVFFEHVDFEHPEVFAHYALGNWEFDVLPGNSPDRSRKWTRGWLPTIWTEQLREDLDGMGLFVWEAWNLNLTVMYRGSLPATAAHARYRADTSTDISDMRLQLKRNIF